ncbi:hypothetical protein SY86_05220 [Erwinia tracheiphila]|uniref:Uncharacterized protein n=1 Tax=Erwinia tracheiphila TaxID=65700 RepID=A0A0M2KDC9_9GAMM|nr:hypothetical protein SY86_05220 [Erwinia tracheiphila]
MTITFPMAHHYCITDTAAHGQEIFKTMIQFPNHEQWHADVSRYWPLNQAVASAACEMQKKIMRPPNSLAVFTFQHLTFLETRA